MAKARFHNKSRPKSAASRMAAPVGIFLFVVVFFVAGTHFLSSGSTKRQKESLEDAISRDIIYCYATTGRYPESLEYIKKTYGLIYDEETFFVDYQVRGSNLIPDVTIIDITASQLPFYEKAAKTVLDLREDAQTRLYDRIDTHDRFGILE